jgi:hypothetical protein
MAVAPRLMAATVDRTYPVPEPIMPADCLRARRLNSAESTVQETAVAMTTSRTATEDQPASGSAGRAAKSATG